MKSSAAAILLLASFASCQQIAPIQTGPVSKKQAACAEGKSLTGSEIDALTWEPSYKTFSQMGQFMLGMENIFSINDRFTEYKADYEALWSGVKVSPTKVAALDKHLGYLMVGYPRYKVVSLAQNVPWWFLAIVHGLEGGYNFTTHLHNGDPLSARTVHVPAGRPTSGRPPFLWEESAKDALGTEESVNHTDWRDPAAIAYAFEGYNGFGYRSKGINSPYLWSFSNQYTAGKYVADGVYSSSAVSSQAGAMVILRHAIDRGVISINELNSAPSTQDQQKYQQQYGNLPPLGGGGSDCAK